MNRNTFFVLFLLISNLVSGQDLKLWYSQPAQNWSEALPIGNSRLGAMVYGGIEREELQLNEETFWAGSPYNNNTPNAVHVLPVVRKLIFEWRNKDIGERKASRKLRHKGKTRNELSDIR